MRFVPTKSVEQLDLQALHRVWARLVRQRTVVINQIRAFPLERGIAVRQGHHFLRATLLDIPRAIASISGRRDQWFDPAALTIRQA